MASLVNKVVVNEEDENEEISNDLICSDCIEPAYVPPNLREIFPMDVLDNETFSSDSKFVVVIGNSGIGKEGKVTRIGGLEEMTQLEELVLRSCLVSKIEGISHLGSSLVKLELYDNQVESIECINNLINLRVLDLSFNSIRSMLPLCGLSEDSNNDLNNNVPIAILPNLEELYLAQNKLRKIEGLQYLTNLRILDLGANRIRVIEGLENNTKLKSLWLGKNKIEEIGNSLEMLINLRQLDIQNNRLTSLPYISNLVELSELYLACNSIKQIPADHLPMSLQTIDLSSNMVEDISGLSNCVQLEELWISSSGIATFQQLEAIQQLPLTCIYLEHSPIAKDFLYRPTITNMFPKMTQIDATLVNRR